MFNGLYIILTSERERRMWEPCVGTYVSQEGSGRYVELYLVVYFVTVMDALSSVYGFSKLPTQFQLDVCNSLTSFV